MTIRTIWGGRADVRPVCAGLAVAVLLVHAGQTAAQTVPYQYSGRSGIGSGPGQTTLPTGGVFEPRIEATAQYANNLSLTPDDEPQVNAAALEMAPGFYASYSTRSVTAAADYSLVGRFWEESDYNDVTHRLSANGEWTAIPEWLTIGGQASYADTVVDPTAGINYGGMGIFRTGDLAELATAGVNPALRHRFNDLELIASYSYGRTWYLDIGKGDLAVAVEEPQDSTDQNGELSIGTARSGTRLFGRAFYDWQKSEFETDLPFEYERAGLDGGLQVSRTLAIVGDVGMESQLDEDTTSGGLDSDFWSAGLRWAPDDRSSAEARFGDRFFGNSYLFSFSHRARLLLFEASYSEEPTVETQTLSSGAFVPGVLPPGDPGGPLGVNNSSPYVGKDAEVAVTGAGSRTRISLTASLYDRQFIDSFEQDDTYTVFAIVATRQLASNLSADVDLSYSDYERETTSSTDLEHYNDAQAIFRLNRNAGAAFTLTGEAGYVSRTGDENYDGWWVGLRARYEP